MNKNILSIPTFTSVKVTTLKTTDILLVQTRVYITKNAHKESSQMVNFNEETKRKDIINLSTTLKRESRILTL